MRTEFDKETYGQRWQVETVFSMIKRNFGETVNARTYWAQCREMMLLVLTHNIAVILLVKELFYRASLSPFPVGWSSKILLKEFLSMPSMAVLYEQPYPN